MCSTINVSSSVVKGKTKMSRRIPMWLWVVIAKSLGIKLHAKDNRRALGVLRGMVGVSSIHTLSGAFDLGVELAAENLQALDALLDEIRSLSDVADTQSHIRLADVTHPDR